MTEVKRVFKVNGKPFFPVGGQSSSSSAYNDTESIPAFEAVKLLHGNTLLTDVYWEVIEPEEGKFDFSSIDRLIANARRYGDKTDITVVRHLEKREHGLRAGMGKI
jgi:beta-galactosidase GanA